MRFTAGVRHLLVLAAMCAAIVAPCLPARADTIIDEWPTIKTPPPPTLQAVTVDPKTTAVLVLDFMPSNCGARPRCLASVPKVAALLSAARAKNVAVVYSYIAGTTVADILPAVAPHPNDPSVKSGADKFIGTDLDTILKAKGITTIIPVGTGAEGAVLYTASHAAFIGYNVVLPVDGMSSANIFAEQYTAWHLANAPGVAAKLKETALGMITF
jgi:nicotinamidase-related amidase